MKILLLIPLQLLLFGCSEKPGSEDVYKALSRDLVSQCKFAAIKNVNVGEVIQPNSANSNRFIVNYTYDLEVKIIGEYVESLAQWRKAQDFKKLLQEVDNQITDSKMALNKWRSRERLPANASSEEFDAEESETKRLEYLVEVERYERIKTLVDSTGGMFELDHRFAPPPAIRLIENIKEPIFPTECLDYSQATPFGLLQKAVGRDGKVNPVDQYINGVSVRIIAESEMFKTEDGWSFR